MHAGIDRNGLELSPNQESLNAYRLTSVNTKGKYYSANAYSNPDRRLTYAMHLIKNCKDPRDAAFIAQEFEKHYSRDVVTDMVLSGDFKQAVEEFLSNLEIPEWKYPAEGLTFEEMECDWGYKKNYVTDAREALIEAFSIFGVKKFPLNTIPIFIAELESRVFDGSKTYRTAAREMAMELLKDKRT